MWPQCWIQNPDGELEFIGTLEGARQRKIIVDNIYKMDRLIAEEKGELRPTQVDVWAPELPPPGTMWDR
jgi:hypothetical protein